MQKTNAAQAHRLPFGKHKGKRLDEVPHSYLQWLLASVRLSSGLRNAIVGELGHAAATTAATTPRPRCHYCGAPALCYWQEDKNGGRRIRLECGSCLKYLRFVPLEYPYTADADRNGPSAPILDALTQLEDLQVELRSNGKTAWIDERDAAKVPSKLHNIVRACAHQLAVAIGDTEKLRGG